MPTVTELRKAGQLDEALTQGLAELAAKPNDMWAKRNLAWVYFEQLKRAATENSFDFLRALAATTKLGLGPEEEMLYPNVVWQVVKRLYALEKASYSIAGWTKVRVNEQDQWTRSGLSSDDSRFRHQTEAHQLLAQVARLPYAVPSEGHSALLKATLHFKEKVCPLKLLLAYPLAEVLRPEDYRGEEYEGRKQKPLAEKAFMAAARELVAGASDYQTEIVAFLPQLERAIVRLPAAQWLPFFKVKLQLSQGDAASAVSTLLPIVRQKSGEFWAWNLLAETLEAPDPAAALACLYRASACRSEEKFLGKVRLKLAQLLADQYPGEARWQLDKLQAAYATEGWPVRGEALTLANRLKDQKAAPAEAARRQWLALAEQTAYGDLPWQPVVVQYIREATADKPAQVRLLPTGPDAKPLSVPLKRYPWLGKSTPGTPVQVRTEQAADYQRVVQVTARPEGKAWDVVPVQVAVLTGFTPDRTLAFFTVQPGLSGAFRPAEFQLPDLTLGDTVEVRLRSQQKEGETKHFALTVAPTRAPADSRICRDFSGAIKILDAGFGFADNVFLPAALIAQHKWQQGDTVSGRAVIHHNKKKGKDEWNVVRVG